jgi:oligoendopeptidase F
MLATFFPSTLDAADWAQIEPHLVALQDRPIGSAKAFEQWLIDRGDLEAAIDEAEANLYISMTCDTENPGKSEAYTRFIENISPRLKPLVFELDRRQSALHERFRLDPLRYTVLERDTRAGVDLFRAENIPIQTELEKLSQEYQKITGAMSVQFEGREQTLPQMGRYQESTDRAVREASFRVVADRRLRDREAIDAVYDRQIERRDQMARNAGFADYVGYAFKSRLRFDYTPRECAAFHEAVEKAVVPFLRRADARRRASLRVDVLRPWDLAVDPKGRGPLRPFEGGRQLMSKTVAMFNALDPRLGAMLARLGDGANAQGSADGAMLDLDSRRGKAPGGYQYMRPLSRKPFIFMNAAGLHSDVVTMAHEAGHAFHSMLCENEPLRRYRSAGEEISEVASMSMELLTLPHMGANGPRKVSDPFYPNEEDVARAKRWQLERSLSILPWIAQIDAFQHWIYSHPRHTRAERTSAWLDLDRRFGHDVSWAGLETIRDASWQRQLHLFGHPFYYIEYGIAELGSLQLWFISLERGEAAAIDCYMNGMRLGGSRPLPDLFEATGLTFDFGYDIVARLTERVERELDKLPE